MSFIITHNIERSRFSGRSDRRHGNQTPVTSARSSTTRCRPSARLSKPAVPWPWFNGPARYHRVGNICPKSLQRPSGEPDPSSPSNHCPPLTLGEVFSLDGNTPRQWQCDGCLPARWPDRLRLRPYAFGGEGRRDARLSGHAQKSRGADAAWKSFSMRISMAERLQLLKSAASEAHEDSTSATWSRCCSADARTSACRWKLCRRNCAIRLPTEIDRGLTKASYRLGRPIRGVARLLIRIRGDVSRSAGGRKAAPSSPAAMRELKSRAECQ